MPDGWLIRCRFKRLGSAGVQECLSLMLNKHNSECRVQPVDFQRDLLNWYDASRRELPWRALPGHKSDPYSVWLSEVMLQQTTVKAVIPYFTKFLAKWPTAEALGEAPRDDVLAAWAGLGYYSRARNLHACAQAIASDGFPKTEAELRKLPGIGAYTAAAIAAIAFDQPAAVVDGNVERVISRIFAIETPMPSARPALRDLAARLTPSQRPGDYAQAMMDLGATLCTPRSPSCLVCPVRGYCAAAETGEPQLYPRKLAKAKRPTRQGHAFVVIRRNANRLELLLRRRKDKGLLGGMMEVPCSEWLANGAFQTAAEGTVTASMIPEGVPASWGNGIPEWIRAEPVQHTFTHFHLEMQVLAAESQAAGEDLAAFEGEWAALENLTGFALPTVMKKAVSSGLEALGLQLPASAASGNSAKRASKVSTVEGSAQPSTRSVRK